ACPGRYLYAKIPQIRTLAAEAQRGWAGRELESNLASTPHPDLIVRRASDGQGFVIPTAGLTSFGKGVTALSGLTSDNEVVASPDLTGDGIGDVVVRAADGSGALRPGTSTGTFGATVKQLPALEGHDLVTAVGDLDGDGRNDLVARWPATGRLDMFLGRGDGSFKVERLAATWGDYTLLAGPGDANGDGRSDLLGRDAAGALWLHPGLAKGGFGTRVEVPGSWKRWTAIAGAGDLTRDGGADLVVRDAESKNGYILPSRGDGTYGPALGPVARVRNVGGLAGAAQVVGDATADLVARSGSRVVVFRNSGGTETAKPIATGVDLSNVDLVLNAGDWDRDGFGDIINRNKNTGALFLRRGDGTGRFGTATKLADGFARVGLMAAVGDMTGDGYPDLMGQPTGAAIRIYPGNGVAGFKTSYVAHGRITAARQVAVGRWDSDGAPDSLFRQGSKLVLFPGNGPGGLTSPRALSVDLTPYDWVIGVSDVALTGHPDVIVRDKATGYLWLLQGTATGFAPRRFLAEGMGEYDLAG
ncbi:MAG TPA: VCBS repeat-containing protein, partial [Nocardioides sp.]|nr:VCBS repeat-containing protein [Nocardioides sp.]